MRRAVVHVNLDPAGALNLAEVERGVAALRHAGFEVVATDLDKLPPTVREVEVLHYGDDAESLRQLVERACAEAVSVTPRAFAVSFISAGTREDALGIIRGFGLEPQLRELRFEGDELAVLVLDGAALRRPRAAKLQTALEAALNREVRFIEA